MAFPKYQRGSLLTTANADRDTSRGLSPVIWNKLPLLDMKLGYSGVFIMDDFVGGPTWAAKATAAAAVVAVGACGAYEAYQDIGTLAANLATETGGVLEISGNDADNDQFTMQFGAGDGTNFTDTGTFKITAGQPLGFEARVKPTLVSDNSAALLIGLGEEGLSDNADVLADNTGAQSDVDFIGFRTLCADGDGLDVVYNTASGGGVTVHADTALVLTAAQWVKLGFYFDGTTFTYFADGRKIGTTHLYSATNVPDGEELTFTLATKVGAAVENKLAIDWWACGLVFDS